MKVYDKANQLAKDLKESEEYLAYKQIKEEVNQNSELKSKIEDFEKIRYDAQLMTLRGEKQEEDKMHKLQEMYDILLKEPKIKEYFDKEVRFNVLLADVNKIIGEAVKDVLK